MYATGQVLKLSFTLEGKLTDLINLFSRTEKSCFQTVNKFTATALVTKLLSESTATASQEIILK